MTTADAQNNNAPSAVDPTIAAQKELEQRKVDALLSVSDAIEMSQKSGNTLESAPSNSAIPDDGTGVVHLDPWLGPWKDEIRDRYITAKEWIDKFNKYEGGLDNFSKVYISNLDEHKKTFLTNLFFFRAMRDMASMCSQIMILYIENGHQMPSQLPSLETSVRFIKAIELPGLVLIINFR